MKPARIVVLATAVGAGGIGALLAHPSEPPPPASAPAVQLETTDVLVAASDFDLGNKVSSQEVRWQTWPVVSPGAKVIRKSERPWGSVNVVRFGTATTMTMKK
jgi:pilus assembly protein CpaB